MRRSRPKPCRSNTEDDIVLNDGARKADGSSSMPLRARFDRRRTSSASTLIVSIPPVAWQMPPSPWLPPDHDGRMRGRPCGGFPLIFGGQGR